MTDDLKCEHSQFCYVNYQGWHHVPGCPHHADTLARERRKVASARAEPRPRTWSYEDIKAEFERRARRES